MSRQLQPELLSRLLSKLLYAGTSMQWRWCDSKLAGARRERSFRRHRQGLPTSGFEVRRIYSSVRPRVSITWRSVFGRPMLERWANQELLAKNMEAERSHSA
jgi:hypothetical protein